MTDSDLMDILLDAANNEAGHNTPEDKVSTRFYFKIEEGVVSFSLTKTPFAS